MLRSKQILAIEVLLSMNTYAQDELPIQHLTPDLLKRHIEFLAADSLEGRKTGERGQKVAASYIQGEFEGMGLLPVSYEGEANPWFQTFQIEDLADFSYLLIDIEGEKPSPGSMKRFLYFGRQYFATPRSIRYECNVGNIPSSGNGLFFRATSLADAIERICKCDTSLVRDFMVSLPDEVYKSIFKEYAFLMRDRLLIRQNGQDLQKAMFTKPRRVDSFQLRAIFAPFLATHSSCNIVITSEREAEKFFVPAEWRKTVTRKTTQPAITRALSMKAIQNHFRAKTLATENVIGVIEGNGKSDEAVIVCAHYDHIGRINYDHRGNKYNNEVCNGADDNASGTAAVIEVARLFAEMQQAGVKPKRSVLFVAFSAEEKGLFGSEYLATFPPQRYGKTYAVLNMDMIGRTCKQHSEDEDYVNTLCKRRKFALKRVNRRNARKVGIKIDTTPGLKERLLSNFGSDHRPFVVRDIPAMVFSTGDHPDYHTPLDDADKINYRRAAKIARLVFLNAWVLANREN
jgi:hypothetical protein